LFQFGAWDRSVRANECMFVWMLLMGQWEKESGLLMVYRRCRLLKLEDPRHSHELKEINPCPVHPTFQNQPPHEDSGGNGDHLCHALNGAAGRSYTQAFCVWCRRRGYVMAEREQWETDGRNCAGGVGTMPQGRDRLGSFGKSMRGIRIARVK
jgi:hypothetical protein